MTLIWSVTEKTKFNWSYGEKTYKTNRQEKSLEGIF